MENIVFDAGRDNKGKGLKASDLVKILKKIDKKLKKSTFVRLRNEKTYKNLW